MNPLLHALFGNGALEFEGACAAGHSDTAEYLLRTGSIPGTRLVASRVAAFNGQEWSWATVERLTRDHDQPSDLTAVAMMFAALHRMNRPCRLEIHRREGSVGMRLGLAGPDLTAWAQRVLAPAILLRVEPAITGSRRGMEDVIRIGIRHRSAPAMNQQQSDPNPSTIIERLGVVETGQWLVTIDCQPLHSQDLNEALSVLTGLRRTAAEAVSETRTLDEVTQMQVNDPAAQQIVDWLTLLLDDLGCMREAGAWGTRTTISAGDVATADMLAAAMTAAGPQDPKAPLRTWIADVLPLGDGPSMLDAGASVIGSSQLSRWLAAPSSSHGQIGVGTTLPPDRMTLGVTREIRLGVWAGTQDIAGIDLDDLEGHAFVAGVTGSGKSTTLLRLLLPMWNVHRVPFLIIDPVKDDYDALAGALSGGLTVLRATDLRLNALRPVSGFDEGAHLDLFGAAFKGAFSMPTPIPYVASLLLDVLRPRVTAGEQLTLHDLQRELRPLVVELGYSAELEANILASLGTRLSMLTASHRAERLCADDVAIGELFTQPTVISLADVGDDEERGFLMAMLMIYVAEQAKVRGARSSVTHVTVIEEAHRLVGVTASTGSSEDRGDAAGHAARLVSQLLAEIRSTGEAVVLLDQSPAAVARDVVRNTNTKILHRLLDPADRELVGGSVGWAVEDTAFLTQLTPGQAAVSNARLPRPQLLQVAPAPPLAADARGRRLDPHRSLRPCCGSQAGLHHAAQRAAAEAEAVVNSVMVGCLVRSGSDNRQLASLLDVQLSRLAARHDLPDHRCLLQIGARATARLWLNSGWVDQRGAEALEATVHSLVDAPDTPVLLPKVPASRVRPFTGCVGCAHACWVRPSARRHPDIGRIREAYRRRPASGSAFVEQWRADLARGLQPALGYGGAADTATCVLLHAIGDVPELQPGATT